MSQKMHILSALLCITIVTASEPSADKSESGLSESSLKLSKRNVDKFDVLRDLDNDIGTHAEPYLDNENIGSDIDDLDAAYSLFDNRDFESSDEIDEDKRAPMGFYGQLGKRAPMGLYGQLGKRAPMGLYGQLGKRAPMGFYGQLGKRAPMGFYGQLGKRAPMGFYGQLGKRAPMGFYGQLGKRAPMSFMGQLGKRAPMSFMGQLDKRPVYSEDIADDTDFSIRERRSSIPWMYANNQRARYLRAKMIKRPNYRFFPQLG